MVMRSDGSKQAQRPRASAADVETLAMAIVSSARFSAAPISADCAKREGGSFGSGGASAAAASNARSSISLVPPPPGIRPTPASTSPM